jgi:hypothetical protein
MRLQYWSLRYRNHRVPPRERIFLFYRAALGPLGGLRAVHFRTKRTSQAVEQN